MKKTAKPFSFAAREKKAPLRGLYSTMADEAETPKDKPGMEEPDAPMMGQDQEEQGEQSHVEAAHTSIEDARSAIESGDTKTALAALDKAEEHLAQCEPSDGQEA